MARDCARALVHALTRSAAAQGCAVTVTDQGWRRWASATFAGARHRLGVSGTPSAAFDAWLSRLADAELSVGGQLVADLGVTAVAREAGETRAAIEVLTLDTD